MVCASPRADERVVALAFAPHRLNKHHQFIRTPREDGSWTTSLLSADLRYGSLGCGIPVLSSVDLGHYACDMHPRFFLPLACTCQEILVRLVPPVERNSGAYFSRRLEAEGRISGAQRRQQLAVGFMKSTNSSDYSNSK